MALTLHLSPDAAKTDRTVVSTTHPERFKVLAHHTPPCHLRGSGSERDHGISSARPKKALSPDTSEWPMALNDVAIVNA